MGVIVPRLSDLVLAIMYEGIDEAAAELGYSTFVMNSRDDPDEQRRKMDIMLARRVDGLIIGDAHLDSGLLRELAARKVPFVLMNRRVPGFPSATCDDVLGGELVAEHLWEQGAPERRRDRRRALCQHGRRPDGRLRGPLAGAGRENSPTNAVVWSRFDTAGGREAAETILAHGNPRPTACSPSTTSRPSAPWEPCGPMASASAATWRWLASTTPPWPRNFPSRCPRSARPCWTSGGRRCSSSSASWTARRVDSGGVESTPWNAVHGKGSHRRM